MDHAKPAMEEGSVRRDHTLAILHGPRKLADYD